MAKHGKKPTDNLAADSLDGVRIGFLAEEDEFDRRALWRLASWGVGAVCAVTIGVLANQSYTHTRRDRTMAVDLAQQSEQIQTVAKENRNELKRLSAAVDTLNADRDRLYARTTTLEQGLESVTGSIARQTATPAAALTPPVPPAAAASEQRPLPQRTAKASEAAHPPPTAQPAPLGAANPAASAMATPTASSTTATAPATPDSPITTTEADTTASIPTQPTPQTQAESKSEIAMLAAEAPALTTPEPTAPAVEVAVPRTEFGVDLGAANTINGLRTLWRRVTASHQAMLADLRPVIALRERKGAATQLRLIAGPLDAAAAAAKICVAMAASHHACETAVFDGQRLAVNVEPAPVTRPPQRHTAPRHAHRETPTARPASPSAPTAPTSTR
jgi:hypothetical protein